MDARIRPSLQARPNCAPCVGHWDYFGTYMLWTRHFRVKPFLKWRLVRYDQIAPERVPSRGR